MLDNITSEENSSSSDAAQNRLKKMLKMAFPHVGLAFFLFLYLLIGAYAFHYQEYDADMKIQLAKLNSIRKSYREIENEVKLLINNSEKYKSYEKQLFHHLSSLSTLHEGREFKSTSSDISDDALPPRWSMRSSVLYALSILTTTGYSYAVPVTPVGQFIAIIYGLIGIPLMVLAAVDFGRFLSHIVLDLYSKFLEYWNKIRIINETQEKVSSIRRKASSFHRLGQQQTLQKNIDTCSNNERISMSDENLEQHSDGVPPNSDDGIPEKRLPLVINASILLIFCMLGGILYIAAGGNATFIESFFLTFNLVANLTMSEMPNDMNHILTIIYIFVFVTCGVAVLSMSAELAALELKDLFMKIHYFGRRINFSRNRSKNEEQMDVQVKELLKIIEEIRRRYPEKEKITTMDILEYMHESSACEKINERRDTIAFMPQTMDIIKFADEQDLEERSFNRYDDSPFVGKTTKLSSVLDVMSFSPDENMEKRFKKELRKFTTEIKYVNRHGKIVSKADAV